MKFTYLKFKSAKTAGLGLAFLLCLFNLKALGCDATASNRLLGWSARENRVLIEQTSEEYEDGNFGLEFFPVSIQFKEVSLSPYKSKMLKSFSGKNFLASAYEYLGTIMRKNNYEPLKLVRLEFKDNRFHLGNGRAIEFRLENKNKEETSGAYNLYFIGKDGKERKAAEKIMESSLSATEGTSPDKVYIVNEHILTVFRSCGSFGYWATPKDKLLK